MTCPFLTDTGICSATDNLYKPSAFELEEYCQTARHKMCPFTRLRRSESGSVRINAGAATGNEKRRAVPGRNQKANTVLVVDDNKCIRDALSFALNGLEDWAAVTAGNGADALGIINSRSIDAVITDLSMPVMDGFELIETIRARRPEVPILVMSAHIAHDDETRLSLLGVEQCFEKPFDLSAVADAIRSLSRFAGNIR